MLTFGFYTGLTLFVIVCLFLILLILIQKGRGGGLASAFGGAGGNTAFGSKTGDVLTWATSIVFGVFIVLAVVLNLMSNSMDAKHKQQASQGNIALPTAPSMPAMPALPGDAPAPTGETTTPAPAAPAAPAPAAAAPAAAAPAPAAPAPAPAAPAAPVTPAPAAPSPTPGQ
jgi:preprotein translocase subunit SecG